MEIRSKSVTIDTAGSAGTSTGTDTVGNMVGFLLDIDLDYHASMPNTCDITITNSEGRTLLNIDNNATDGLYVPRAVLCNSTGGALTAYDYFILDGGLVTIGIEQADELTDALVVKFRYLAL